MSSKAILFSLVIMSLGFNIGCESAGKRTGIGAASGAVVGGAVGAARGGAKGAAIGAAAGGAAGGGIGYYLDQRAKELEKVVETKKTEEGLMVTLENQLLFGFDETKLTPQAKQTIAELAAILKKYPGDELVVTGFTDKVGTTEYNKQLSKERATVVKQQLTAKGVDPERVSAVGVGETRAKGSENEPRQEDRKVEIYIDPKIPEQIKQS